MRLFARCYVWLCAAILWWTFASGNSVLSIYRDEVYIDAGTQGVAQTVSTSILGLNLPTMDAFITAKGAAEYKGILYPVNQAQPPPSLTTLDHVALFAAGNVSHLYRTLPQFKYSHVVAVIFYPESESVDLTQTYSVATLQTIPGFYVTHAVGKQLYNDIQDFNQNPGENKTRAVVSNSNTTTGKGDENNSYHRVMVRIEQNSDSYTVSVGGGPNLKLALGISLPLVAIVISAAVWFLYSRLRSSKPSKRSQPTDSATHRARCIESLLARPVRSRKAPPLDREQLHLLNMVKITKENYHLFPLSTGYAIKRFRDAVGTFSTSSDEDSDGDDNVFFVSQLEEKSNQRSATLGSTDDPYCDDLVDRLATANAPHGQGKAGLRAKTSNTVPAAPKKDLLGATTEKDDDIDDGADETKRIFNSSHGRNSTGDNDGPRLLPIMAAMMARKQNVLGLPNTATPARIQLNRKKVLNPIVIPTSPTTLTTTTPGPTSSNKTPCSSDPLTTRYNRSTSPCTPAMAPSKSAAQWGDVLPGRMPTDATASTTVTSSTSSQAATRSGTSGKVMSSMNSASRHSLMVTLRRKASQQTTKGRPRCGVCHEVFEMGEMARRLRCQHIFHPPCVDQWLTLKTARCPVCKMNCTPRVVGRGYSVGVFGSDNHICHQGDANAIGPRSPHPFNEV
ncbi:hypothetical protein H4R35_004045 [Dimargaris xerosporica]|nr:hypothetical protein H4R35_004045 [Dimargaris xerosporica]